MEDGAECFLHWWIESCRKRAGKDDIRLVNNLPRRWRGVLSSLVDRELSEALGKDDIRLVSNLPGRWGGVLSSLVDREL